jgi:hypothetical protein
MRAAVLALAISALSGGSAAGQGLWFDIGSGESARIYCEDDAESWIEFAPYPFGETWPEGTLVYAELARRTDEKLAVVYNIHFNDGGCRCGSDLLRPLAFRFHYDESAVTWPEASTTLYRRNGELWKKESALLDVEGDVFLGSYWGFIVGVPTFGIGPSDAFDERPSSWGRVKALYSGND